jgi:arylsulfatase
VLSTKNKSHSPTAEVVVPDDGGEGVVVVQGGITGGWSLYFSEGRLRYCYNFLGLNHDYVGSEHTIEPGTHQVRMEFTYDGGGVGKGGAINLYVDGEPVGEGRLERAEPYIFSCDETCDVGADYASAVSPEYTASESEFNGTVNWVEIGVDQGAEDVDHYLTAEERYRVALGVQ